MKRKTLFITILLLSMVAIAQTPMTLEECINTALKNNRSAKQQRLNSKNKDLAYQQARAELLPNLNASAGQTFTFGRSIGIDNTYKNSNAAQTNFYIGSEITLFDGMQLINNIKARKADLNASNADLNAVENEIRLSVTTAFLQVLLNKELLLLAQQQLEMTAQNIDSRTKLIDNGKVAKGEIYELEAQQAREETQRIQAENNLKLSLLDLAQIMDIDDFLTLDIQTSTAEDMIEANALIYPKETYAEALLHRPEIQANQYRLESRQKEVLIAKSQYLPKLTLRATTGSGYYKMNPLPPNAQPFDQQLKNNLSTSIGLTLNIPIFNNLQVRNKVKNAELAVENSLLEMEKVKIELKKQIEQAYYNALSAQNRWKASQKSEKASSEAYRFAQQKYDNGKASVYELYQAKNNLAQQLSEQTQAKYEYAFRLKILALLKR